MPLRARKTDILIWTLARKVLTEYARAIANLNDTFEAERLRETLLGEIAAIVPNGGPDGFPEIWKQAATEGVKGANEQPNGVKAYALDRLGLWPEKRE